MSEIKYLEGEWVEEPDRQTSLAIVRRLSGDSTQSDRIFTIERSLLRFWRKQFIQSPD